MKRLVIILLLSVLASSCSLWDMASGVLKPTPGLSVDTEIVAGDKKEEVNTDVTGEKTVNTAENITYNITEDNVDYTLFIVALIGWIAPSPRQIWLSIKQWVTFIKRGPAK